MTNKPANDLNLANEYFTPLGLAKFETVELEIEIRVGEAVIWKSSSNTSPQLEILLEKDVVLSTGSNPFSQ